MPTSEDLRRRLDELDWEMRQLGLATGLSEAAVVRNVRHINAAKREAMRELAAL